MRAPGCANMWPLGCVAAAGRRTSRGYEAFSSSGGFRGIFCFGESRCYGGGKAQIVDPTALGLPCFSQNCVFLQGATVRWADEGASEARRDRSLAEGMLRFRGGATCGTNHFHSKCETACYGATFGDSGPGPAANSRSPRCQAATTCFRNAEFEYSLGRWLWPGPFCLEFWPISAPKHNHP